MQQTKTWLLSYCSALRHPCLSKTPAWNWYSWDVSSNTHRFPNKITVFLTGIPHLCLPHTHTIDLCFFLIPTHVMQMRPPGSIAQPRRAEIDQFNHTVSSEREHLHCKRKWKYTHMPIDLLWGGRFVILNDTDRPAGSLVKSLFGKSSLGPTGCKNNGHLQILEKTVCKTWWINYLPLFSSRRVDKL